MALARYLGAREDLRGARVTLTERAEAASRSLGSGGPQVRSALAVEVDGLALVESGTTDAFGIARGARVTFWATHHPGLAPADRASFERELIDAATRLEASGGKTAVVAVSSGEDRFLVARVALRDDAGAHAGMLEMTVAYPGPAPVVPGWLFLVSALAAIALGGLASRRTTLSLVTGLGAAGLLAPAGAGLAVAAGASAAALAALAGPGLTGVLVGLREKPTAYLYVLPAILAMLGLVFVPFVMGVVLAFFDTAGEPVGFANFTEVLAPDPTSYTAFWRTFGVTVLWTVANVVLHVSIGLALALVLNRPTLTGRSVYRVLLIVPWAVPNYITALVWKWMFNTEYGAFNALGALFDLDPVNWLEGSFASAFLANLATNTWLGFPFVMVVALGALQSIPAELYEAATLDGASRWQRFRHVTLPLLKPALVPAVILGSVWTFNMFNVIYLVSGGGPDHQTDILVTEAYYHFKVLKRFGLAAAYALLIFGVLAVYGWLTSRVTRATEGAYQ
jgi:ABC-type sugar transport system permease subunit